MIASMNETLAPAARITANVRALMHARGYERAKDLGAALNWNESKISRALKGNRWPLDELDAVARALRVSASDLLRDPSDYLPVAAGSGRDVGTLNSYSVPRNVQVLGKNRTSKPRTPIRSIHRINPE